MLSAAFGEEGVILITGHEGGGGERWVAATARALSCSNDRYPSKISWLKKVSDQSIIIRGRTRYNLVRNG